jgi:hypothetical protein
MESIDAVSDLKMKWPVSPSGPAWTTMGERGSPSEDVE